MASKLKEPMLIILGGLPGTGKTTLSRLLAQSIGAVHLRIDTIEIAITHSTLMVKDPENAGYLAAYGIAKDNLLIGRTVIADNVNSIQVTRDAWREVAVSTGCNFVEIEISCSDKKEHLKRVQNRTADIKGHELPTWQEIIDHDYEHWKLKGLHIDTAVHNPEHCVSIILQFLSQQ